MKVKYADAMTATGVTGILLRYGIMHRAYKQLRERNAAVRGEYHAQIVGAVMMILSIILAIASWIFLREMPLISFVLSLAFIGAFAAFYFLGVESEVWVNDVLRISLETSRDRDIEL